MKIPTDDKLKFAVWLYKNLENCKQVESRKIIGKLPDNIAYSDIESALEQFDMACDMCSEENRIIHFEAPHQGGFFAWSMEDFLANPKRSLNAPKRFYLADYDYLHPENENEMPENVKAYFQRLSVIQALQPPFADYRHETGGLEMLGFIADRKLEIQIKISHASLAPLKTSKNAINDFINTSSHQDQKQIILKSCLIEIFFDGNNHSKKIDINDVFKNLDMLIERAKNSYDLFTSEFSFKKIKNEIEREKLDFTIKLNNVFSSIQNQLLAIPIALVLIGGQMENTGAWAQKNIVIWLGALVFALLLSLMVRNQKSTISAIRQEIDQQWKQIEDDHRSVAHRFQDLYSALENRRKDQTHLIFTVEVLVVLSLALASAFLLWISVPEPLMILALWCSLTGVFIYPVGLWIWRKVAKRIAKLTITES